MLRLRHQASDSPLYQAEPSTKLAITNLSFELSEKELLDYLKDYGAIWVILPVQSVYGFRKNHPQPLGIAYAEFESVEKAQAAIDALFNQLYKGRPMKLRFHQPYVPKQKQKWRRKPTSPINSEIVLDGDEIDTQEAPDNDSSSSPTERPPVYKFKREGNKRNQVSKETVYCKELPEGTTDMHLRQHFKEYQPKEIWIFRSSPIKKGCFGGVPDTFTSALVTLNTEESLKKVAKIMSKKKLLDRKVDIKPALLSKIDEVKNIAQLEHPVSVVPDPEHQITSVPENSLEETEQESERAVPVVEARTYSLTRNEGSNVNDDYSV